jgi:pimeloyl-ACP methyl ester carboxylesterase
MIATSADGTKIAYEVTGSGPALMLVHGGGQTRRSWNQLGYVERLAKRFTVITVDMRGTGDSDKPTTADAYALDRVLGDLVAVADAAGAKRFNVWGFGHGGTIARYLAARSDRVNSAVLVGMTMGPAATGVFKTAIEAMRAKWQPVIAAHTAGKLDVKTLSTSDRTAWEAGIASNVLSLGALIDYPPLEPGDIKVPTLWAVGADDSAMENVKEYEAKLKGTQVTLKVLSSVNYSDSFIKLDQVMTDIEPFLAKVTTTT